MCSSRLTGRNQERALHTPRAFLVECPGTPQLTSRTAGVELGTGAPHVHAARRRVANVHGIIHGCVCACVSWNEAQPVAPARPGPHKVGFTAHVSGRLRAEDIDRLEDANAHAECAANEDELEFVLLEDGMEHALKVVA